MTTTTYLDGETSTPPECVGPLSIAPRLALTLRALSEEAAVDDLVPLWVCATELVRRFSAPERPIRVHVICGPLEAVTPPAEPWNSVRSFREALAEPAGCRMSTAPVELAVLVSQDRERLYVERTTDAPDVPTAQCWAQRFLRLLTALADEADAPLTAHALPDDDA